MVEIIKVKELKLIIPVKDEKKIIEAISDITGINYRKPSKKQQKKIDEGTIV